MTTEIWSYTAMHIPPICIPSAKIIVPIGILLLGLAVPSHTIACLLHNHLENFLLKTIYTSRGTMQQV